VASLQGADQVESSASGTGHQGAPGPASGLFAPEIMGEVEVGRPAEALTLACPEGYIGVFADEGPPMAALLAWLIAAQRTDRAADQA